MDKIYEKRILFVGMPDMATVVFKRLIDKGFNIVGIVSPPNGDSTFFSMEKLANYYKIPFLKYSSLKDGKFLKDVRKLKADIGIVCSYSKKLPKEFLQTTRDGFLNLHPSLLPYYRGGNPYSAVIRNFETFTGVTVHFMDENFDTGDIVLQAKVDIEPNETMGTLFNKLNFTSANAIEVVLERYESESALPRQPQPEGEFVKAPNYPPNSYQTLIDWHNDGATIEAQVRALNPFILATTTFRHLALKIHSCEFEKKRTNIEPGLVADLTNGFGISCSDGIIHVKALQLGTFIVTDGVDFVRRFSPKVGEKLG